MEAASSFTDLTFDCGVEGWRDGVGWGRAIANPKEQLFLERVEKGRSSPSVEDSLDPSDRINFKLAAPKTRLEFLKSLGVFLRTKMTSQRIRSERTALRGGRGIIADGLDKPSPALPKFEIFEWTIGHGALRCTSTKRTC
jgi:hypothetical protein